MPGIRPDGDHPSRARSLAELVKEGLRHLATITFKCGIGAACQQNPPDLDVILPGRSVKRRLAVGALSVYISAMFHKGFDDLEAAM